MATKTKTLVHLNLMYLTAVRPSVYPASTQIYQQEQALPNANPVTL